MGLGKTTARSIKKAGKKGTEFSSDEARDKYFAQQAQIALDLESQGKINQAQKVKDALQKSYGVDVANLPDNVSQYLRGGSEDADSGLGSIFPDKATEDLLRGKGGDTILSAMMLEENLQGRDEALSLWEGREDDFLNDPLVQQLQSSASDLLENPDIISDDMMQDMLAGSDAILSRSYQGDQANLAGQIGSLGMDPNDPLAQSLAAQGRFSALQGQSQNRINLQTQAAQLNRQGLENAMRLGLGTASFTQGGINEIIGAQSALHTFQPINQSGMFAAGINQLNNLEAPDTMSPWAQAGLGAAGSLLNFAGDYGMQSLFGLGGDDGK